MATFDYVKYDHVAMGQQAVFKKRFEELEALAYEQLQSGRARSLFLTSLEEAYMWVGKSIRDEQIERTGKTDLEESRGDEEQP